ncbi:hypothetical protein BDV40DRAFT_263894 [Aspergillus tamarii]|uniref:Uncharacterized protein n=1 Tax=Aspergillus tamarii TaxID=41984 RepID=A0A5N6UWU7_ASPTM|nr:hypothetical protein BDV40DRAFT_263894 [Aspergillus tamarii]
MLRGKAKLTMWWSFGSCCGTRAQRGDNPVVRTWNTPVIRHFRFVLTSYPASPPIDVCTSNTVSSCGRYCLDLSL